MVQRSSVQRRRLCVLAGVAIESDVILVHLLGCSHMQWWVELDAKVRGAEGTKVGGTETVSNSALVK